VTIFPPSYLLFDEEIFLIADIPTTPQLAAFESRQL